MILNEDGTNFETNSLYKKTNWYKDDRIIIDETTSKGKKMKEKVIKYSPNIDLEFKNGFVTKVTANIEEYEKEKNEKVILDSIKPSDDEVKIAERQINLINDLKELGVI